MATAQEVTNKLGKLRSDLTEVERQWKLKVIWPYCNKYIPAYESFMKAYAAAEKASQERMEMALLGLSIAGGGVMTAVFGSTCIKTLGQNSMISVICNRNMTRTFDALAYIDKEKPWAGFVAGRLLEEAATLIGKAAQDKIKSIADAPMSKSTLAEMSAEQPGVVQNTMLAFMTEQVSKAYQLTEAIEASSASPDKKLAAARAMLASPLYSYPPELNTGGLQETIELGFCMKLLISSDFLVTKVRNQPGKNTVHASTTNVSGIAARPGSAGYPKSQRPTDAWAYGSSWKEVQYQQLNWGFDDYVDGLSKRVMGKPFFSKEWYEFNASVDAAAVLKAHNTLDELAGRKRLAPLSTITSLTA